MMNTVLKIVREMVVLTFFYFGDRSFTMLNLDKCMLQLQSWQPTVTFHNFLKGGENNFWKIIDEIDQGRPTFLSNGPHLRFKNFRGPKFS